MRRVWALGTSFSFFMFFTHAGWRFLIYLGSIRLEDTRKVGVCGGDNKMGPNDPDTSFGKCAFSLFFFD